MARAGSYYSDAFRRAMPDGYYQTMWWGLARAAVGAASDIFSWGIVLAGVAQRRRALGEEILRSMG